MKRCYAMAIFHTQRPDIFTENPPFSAKNVNSYTAYTIRHGVKHQWEASRRINATMLQLAWTTELHGK